MQSQKFNSVRKEHIAERKKLIISKIIIPKAQLYGKTLFPNNNLPYPLYHIFSFLALFQHPGNTGSIAVNIRSRTAHVYIHSQPRKFTQNPGGLFHVVCIVARKLPDNFFRHRSRIYIVFFKLAAGKQGACIYHFSKIFVAGSKLFY